MKVHYIIFVLLSIYSISVCGQSKTDSLNKKHAEKELELALSNQKQHNVIDFEYVIIKDSTMATAIAETILFGIYGKEKIVRQKPYEIHHIKNYWILAGTLPQNMKGGTFLIILDDRNSQVIKITHGK